MNMRRLHRIGVGLIACAGILFLLPLHLLGQDNYEVPASVIDAGGGRGSSQNFNLISIVGEAAPDEISSNPNNEVGSGFKYMYTSFGRGEMGDINGDGTIDVLDLVRGVNIILQIPPPPTPLELWAADCNGDGVIDVLDLIAMVNVILEIWPECPGRSCRPQMTPEIWEYLRTLKAYLSEEDYNRFMILVKTELGLPTEFRLSQNYPNPFNLQTLIQYQLAEESWVSLRIYNIQGQAVRTLADEQQEVGYYTVPWDGRDDRGVGVATGLYFYRIQAGTYTKTMKMLLLK